ncbi:MAG TPA: dethiobiotin synthase [Trebonia sp.]
MSQGQGRSNILIITGTGTGVGKTVVTAAIAALARARGASVAVVKPAQTGISSAGGTGGRAAPPAGGTGGRAAPPCAGGVWGGSLPPGDTELPDTETVTRLSGVTDTHELARYPDPLSPEAASRMSGLPPLDMDGAADYIAKLAADRDLVLVEGAGGLLVRYDAAGTTIATLAAALGAPTVIVAAPGLGTLNHTALTLEALAARDIGSLGVVIGSWPLDPGLAERNNLADLEAIAGGPLAGVLPAGAGQLARGAFVSMARESLVPRLGGLRAA